MFSARGALGLPVIARDLQSVHKHNVFWQDCNSAALLCLNTAMFFLLVQQLSLRAGEVGQVWSCEGAGECASTLLIAYHYTLTVLRPRRSSFTYHSLCCAGQRLQRRACERLRHSRGAARSVASSPARCWSTAS